MVQTFIKDLSGENSAQVWGIIKTYPEYYGEVDAEIILACQFYGLYLEDNSLVGFFGLDDWGYGKEKIICYVYIFEPYRQRGLFNKIIKWVKKHCYEAIYISIGATVENKLATEIYSRKFDWIRYSEEDKGNWYCVVNRSNVKLKKMFEKCLTQ